MNVPVDCLNIIASKLCYIDLLAFMYASKYHYNSIYRIYCDADYVIRRYMSKHDLCCNTYKIRIGNNIIHKEGVNNSIVFGGFIFKVLYDMPMTDKSDGGNTFVSDIDILHYTHENNVYKRCDKLTIYTGCDNNKIKIYDCSNGKICETGVIYANNTIEKDRTSIDKIKYQHLVLQHDVSLLTSYLNDYCDFDITRSYTDGKRFYIKDLNKMFNRCEDVNVTSVYNKEFRLFTNEYKWSINQFHQLYDNVLNRIRKYRNRDIKLNTNDDLESSGQCLKRIISTYNLQIFDKELYYSSEGSFKPHFKRNKLNDFIDRFKRMERSFHSNDISYTGNLFSHIGSCDEIWTKFNKPDIPPTAGFGRGQIIHR